MSYSMLLIMIIAFASSKTYKNSKFALMIKPFRGYVVTLVGSLLLVYSIFHTPGTFIFCVIAFILILMGIIYTVADHKSKKIVK